MNCKQVREEFFDLAGGPASGSPAVYEHLRACTACAAELDALRKTMSLLDDWQAPEPSPFFDARLRARLRDESAVPRTWREWLREAVSPFSSTGRKLALGAAMTVLVGAGVALFQSSHAPAPNQNQARVMDASAKTGTAVSDLQALDRNEDLYASFDLLDDVNQ